jgi:hypothetical protein
MKEHNISLADFAVECGQQSEGKVRDLIRGISLRLASKTENGQCMKRFVYNNEVEAVVYRLAKIPFELFVAQYERIIMPFDAFWIENTPPLNPLSPDDDFLQRLGMLVWKDKGEIRVRYVQELLVPQRQTYSLEYPEPPVGFIKSLGFHVRNDRYAAVDDVEYVLNEKGITILDENCMARYPYRNNPSGLNRLRSNDIKNAEYIYRLLVLISSKNVITNIVSTQPVIHKNKGAQRNPLHPIRIDLALEVEQSLYNNDVDTTRELLGWTSVIRHRRTYHTKNGPIEKIIEPHDRRIAAPVDRRGVSRVFTSSNPNLSLDLSAERPRIKTKFVREEPSGQ